MKLKFALKVLPYIQIEKDLGRKLGSSKLFFTWLDDQAHHSTDDHEEVHIVWWYALTAIIFGLLCWLAPLHPLYCFLIAMNVDPVLGTFVKPYTRLEESFAYAKEAVVRGNTEQYLNGIAHPDSIQSQRYGKDFHELVRKRVKWFK